MMLNGASAQENTGSISDEPINPLNVQSSMVGFQDSHILSSARWRRHGAWVGTDWYCGFNSQKGSNKPTDLLDVRMIWEYYWKRLPLGSDPYAPRQI